MPVGYQPQQMITKTGELLAQTPPVAATIGKVLYHPEAIMLAAEPAQALLPIHDAVETAWSSVTGHVAETRLWRPHITLCYSTSAQPALPIINALGAELGPASIHIDSASLVIQRGPERLWDWQTIGTIRLPAPART